MAQNWRDLLTAQVKQVARRRYKTKQKNCGLLRRLTQGTVGGVSGLLGSASSWLSSGTHKTKLDAQVVVDPPRLLPIQQSKALFVGLENSGKTTLCHQAGFLPSPHCGRLAETCLSEWVSDKLLLLHWDIGGTECRVSDAYRNERQLFLDKFDAVIFVVDSADASRFSLAGIELHRLIGKAARTGNAADLQQFPLLVFANKQDHRHAQGLATLHAELRLDTLLCEAPLEIEHGRPIRLQPCSALTGSGINDGLAWLREQL